MLEFIKCIKRPHKLLHHCLPALQGMQSPKPQCRIDPLSHAYPVNASFTSHHAYVHLNTAMHNHMYACVNDCVCVCVCVPANVSICVCVCVRKPSHHVALIFHAFSWQCQNFACSFCSCSFSLSQRGSCQWACQVASCNCHALL